MSRYGALRYCLTAQHRHAADSSTGPILALGSGMQVFPAYRVRAIFSLRLMASRWVAPLSEHFAQKLYSCRLFSRVFLLKCNNTSSVLPPQFEGRAARRQAWAWLSAFAATPTPACRAALISPYRGRGPTAACNRPPCRADFVGPILVSAFPFYSILLSGRRLKLGRSGAAFQAHTISLVSLHHYQ